MKPLALLTLLALLACRPRDATSGALDEDGVAPTVDVVLDGIFVTDVKGQSANAEAAKAAWQANCKKTADRVGYMMAIGTSGSFQCGTPRPITPASHHDRF